MMWQLALRKFVDDTKLGIVADMPADCPTIQRNLDRLEKWANRNHITLNREECKVLHLGRNHPILEEKQLESTLEGNDLEILVNTRLNMSKQCTLVGQKSKSVFN